MASTLNDRTFKCPGSRIEKDNRSRHVMGLLTTFSLLEKKNNYLLSLKKTNHHEIVETNENASFILE